MTNYADINQENKYPQLNFVAEDILNSMNALVHIDDLYNQRMVWGNERFKEVLGSTAKEVIEMGNEYMQIHYHPDDIKEIPKIIDCFKNNKSEKHSTFFRVKHRNGSWVYFITTRSLYKNDPKYVVSVSINITDKISCGLMLEEFNKIMAAKENEDIIKQFSKREIEVLSLVSQGYTSPQIAEELFLSIRTINNHRTNILKKSNSHNNAELMNFINKTGILHYKSEN